MSIRSISDFIQRHALLLVVVVAVGLRLGIFFAFPGVFRFDDSNAIHGSEAYDTYARNLLATGVYGRTPGVPDAVIPPLYSYALAGVYALFGRASLTVALFHTALDVLCMVFLYHTARKLLPLSRLIGLLAVLGYALYPYLIFQNLTLIDTPFFMVLLFGFVLCMVLLRERPHFDRGAWALAVVGGVLLGLSLLTRALLPLLALLVALWFVFRVGWWQTVARLLPVAVVGLLVVLPWIVRNFSVYQAFVPTALNFGDNFYQGSSVYTIPYFRAGYDVQWVPPPPLQADDHLSLAASQERFQAGLTYLRTYPEQIPDLLWTKFLVYWSIDIAPRLNPVEGQVPRLDYHGNVIAEDNGGALELGGLPPGDPVGAYSTPLFDQIGRTVHRFYWGGLFLLGLLGIVVTAKQWRGVSLLWFIQISMTVMYVVFHPSTRYRVPTDPYWFIFSAAALVWLWERWQARRSG